MDVKTKKTYESTNLWIVYKWNENFGSDLIEAFFGRELSGIVIMVESVDSENAYIK